MARIYFDPDKDELVSTRKLTPKEREKLQRLIDKDTGVQSSHHNSTDKELLRKMDELEDAIRENTETVQMYGQDVQNRHMHDLDTAATIAGGIIGFQAASGFIDGIIDTFDPFSDGCTCKKKKWF